MSSTTVAPLESYTSTVATPDNYAQFGDVQGVEVTLVDSNLWLVDNTQLNMQTTDPTTSVYMLQDPSYQTIVPLKNIQATAAPISLPLTGSGLESVLPGLDLPTGDALQLMSVTGSLALGSGSTPTAGGAQSLSADGSLPQFSGPTGTTLSSSSGITSGGLGGIGGGGGTPGTDGTVVPLTDGVMITPSGPIVEPVPVPFGVSPTLGLLVLAVGAALRRGWRYRHKHWVTH